MKQKLKKKIDKKWEKDLIKKKNCKKMEKNEIETFKNELTRWSENEAANSRPTDGDPSHQRAALLKVPNYPN